MFQNLLCAIYHLKDDDLDYTLLSVDAKFMSKKKQGSRQDKFVANSVLSPWKGGNDMSVTRSSRFAVGVEPR